MKVKFDAEKIAKAIEAVTSGVCKRVDVDADTKVYECKNVIRIDLKCQSDG